MKLPIEVKAEVDLDVFLEQAIDRLPTQDLARHIVAADRWSDTLVGDLVAALVNEVAGDELAALITSCGDRSTALLDILVKRAVETDRVPDDYVPARFRQLAGDADTLHRMIVERREDDALDLLRQMFPDQDFMTVAA